MRNWKPKSIAIIFALIASVIGYRPALAADKVILMLNWYVYGEHVPFYYGLQKGIYAAEGIDLDIQEGRGSGITTQAVAASIQLSPASADALSRRTL